MRTSNKILFDTNTLVYQQDKKNRHYSQVLPYFHQAATKEIQGVLCSQNIAEFTAVLTNTTKIRHNRSAAVIAHEVGQILNSRIFEVIYPNQETCTIFLKLLSDQSPENSRHIFDIFLVATMLSNNIHTILTFNEKDFAHFGDIKVITP